MGVEYRDLDKEHWERSKQMKNSAYAAGALLVCGWLLLMGAAFYSNRHAPPVQPPPLSFDALYAQATENAAIYLMQHHANRDFYSTCQRETVHEHVLCLVHLIDPPQRAFYLTCSINRQGGCEVVH